MTRAKLTLVSALALLFSAASGSVLAGVSGGVTETSASTDAPDCKKQPEHPRCADKK